MAFSRLKYDECNEKLLQESSLKASDYYMNPPIDCNNNCYQSNPMIRMQKNGVSMNKNYQWRYYAGPVDVESDLYNLTRVTSKCPAAKYQPLCGVCGKSCENQIGENVGMQECKKCKKCKTRDNNLKNMPECYFKTSNVRFEEPPCLMREKVIDRFLPMDNDINQLFFPGEFDVNTRQAVKDDFNPCILRPNINNMNPEK